MKTYLVGGAVRDLLLNIEPNDRDYVVVGASQEEMLGFGFKQVGLSFPVFLHPITNEEFALARTERKVGTGYHGFEFNTDVDVPIEADLFRRDLTINAIAIDQETGVMIDPYGGQKDLANKIIRHVSIHFAEDPLRVLRVARFLARYHKLGFTVHEDTTKLCSDLVLSGEVASISADRIWLEVEKIIKESNPSVAFEFLSKINALKLVPNLNKLIKNTIFFTEFLDEVNLTDSEKFYFFININNPKFLISDLKVPKSIVRECQFYYIIHMALTYEFMGEVGAELLINHILLYLDKYRDEFMGDEFDKISGLMKKIKSKNGELIKTKLFLAKLKTTVNSIYNFDFTNLTSNIPPKDIKELVRITKRRLFIEYFFR